MTATIAALLSSWGPLAVLLVMGVVFAETGLMVGFLLPGDSLLFLTGALIAAGALTTPLWVAIPLVALAAVVGNQVGYAIGRRYGPRVLSRPSSRWLAPRHLDTARDFFARHGTRAVVLARFVPVARTLVPVLAGVGGMPRRTFLTHNVAGALAWVTLLTTAGFLLGGVPFVAAHIEVLTLALVALSLLPAAASVLRARRHRDPTPRPDAPGAAGGPAPARSRLAGAVCPVLLAAACSPASAPAEVRTPAATDGAVSKLLVLVVENRSFEQMKSQMPYVFGLARQYGYASDFTAIRHPSLPNYLAMAGGSTFGVTDDDPPSAHTASGPSVFGDAVRAGKTATIYNEGMTGTCALTPGGTDGRYAVKHNAWAYFVDERALCRKHDVPMTDLDADIAAGRLPNAGQIIPDTCHDAHDLVPGCSLTEADQWMRTVLTKVLAGPDYRSGRLAVVVTADEDSYRDGNHILTTVFHPSQRAHVVRTPLTTYSLSRLYSQVLGTKPLGDAATAPDMAKAFGLPIAP